MSNAVHSKSGGGTMVEPVDAKEAATRSPRASQEPPTREGSGNAAHRSRATTAGLELPMTFSVPISEQENHAEM